MSVELVEWFKKKIKNRIDILFKKIQIIKSWIPYGSASWIVSINYILYLFFVQNLSSVRNLYRNNQIFFLTVKFDDKIVFESFDRGQMILRMCLEFERFVQGEFRNRFESFMCTSNNRNYIKIKVLMRIYEIWENSLIQRL